MSWSLITYAAASGPRAGIAVGSGFVDAADATGHEADSSALKILEDWEAAAPRLQTAFAAREAVSKLETATLLPPVFYPVTIYCAGANYTDHVAHMAKALNMPEEPDPHDLGLLSWHFLKPSRTAVGHNAIIALASPRMDWEGELAAVIGRVTRNVAIGDALSYVAGYTIANDLSARDRIARPGIAKHSPFYYDWVGQKCFDGGCPLGPAIIPASEIADPQDLTIKTWVNGESKQDSSTRKMIFTVAEQIAHLSSRLTLYPGDVVLTGTPAGVGAETGQWLTQGDVVTVEIGRLGQLITRIGPPAF